MINRPFSPTGNLPEPDRGGLKRRSLLRGSLGLFGLAALGRGLEACDNGSVGFSRAPRDTDDYELPTPTDGDEYVPGTDAGPPVDTGDGPPKVPQQTWEARARQLEDEQKRLGYEVFTKTSPGPWAGKERSHVPVPTAETVNGVLRVTVLVEHVMGKNALDAGPAPEAAAPEASVEAGADASDGGRADAATDAGDGGSAPAVDAGRLPEHYITTIYVRADVNGSNVVVGLWEFASTDAAPPSVRFAIPAGATNVTAYEFCTLHGLWKADPLPA